jgi:hypothetical protein
MRALFQFFIRFTLVLYLAAIAVAQETKPVNDPRSALTITAFATSDHVRFVAPSSVVQIRLEVYNSTGNKLFDNEVRSGNVLDWHLQDGQAEPLADDTYLCVITVKRLSGKLTQRIGSVTVEKNSASVQPIDASQMTAQQSQAIGPVEENASLTVLKEDDNRTTTVIAHNGEDGQITRGRGALSFRIGDFFSGKDIEQMRLTPEGNLGIGITHPLVRLDVDGLVRASQGIVFPDGSIQYSAATKTFGAKSSLPDPTFQSLQSKSGKKGSGGQEHIDAAGTGTLNFISKWAETGGSGTLQNSSIFDDGFMLSIGPGMNQPAPGGALVFDLQRPSSSDVLQRFWNTGGGGAKLRYVAATGATSQVQLTDLDEWLMSIAGNNQIGMQFRVRDTPDPNTENGLAAAVRMTIARNGNVGIGTSAPNSKLDIAGSSPLITLREATGNTGAYIFESNGNLNLAGSFFAPVTIDQAGKLGIGNGLPKHQLSINGGPGWTSNGWAGAVSLSNASAIGWQGNAAGNRFGIGQSGGGLYFFRTASDPGTTGSAANYDLLIDDSGNVGIGTITPSQRLTVKSAPSSYGLLHTDGNVQVGTFVGGSTGGGWFGTKSNHPLSFFVNNGGPSMTIDNTTGNISQPPATNGLVKAMLLVNPDGSFDHCYNSQLTGSAATTVPCGIGSSHTYRGIYDLTFPFQVNSRFFSATIADLDLQVFIAVRPSSSQVVTFELRDQQLNLIDAPFYLIVY